MFGGVGKSAGWATILGTVGFVLSGSVSAKAADLGGNCCADLEERVAELEATTARKGNRKVSLTVSGWVNEQVLYWDDGTESNVYVGNNDQERSRFRFVGEAKIDKDWSAGYVIELGVQGVHRANGTRTPTFPSNTLPFNQDSGTLIRKSNWFIKSKTFRSSRCRRQWHGNVPPARRCGWGEHSSLCGRRGACRLYGRLPVEKQRRLRRRPQMGRCPA